MPRIRYADLVRDETPRRRRMYLEDRAYRLEKEAQAERQRQQEAALAEQERQYNESLGLQQQQVKDAQQQANTSNTIAGLGLAKSGYPYLKKGYNAITGLGEEVPKTYGLSTRETYGLPSRPDYNPQFPDTAINDPNAPVVDPNVGVSPQYPDIAVNDVNAPLLTPPPEEWGTPLQRMYPDIAMNEPGTTSGILGGGSAVGGAGADVAGLGPNGVFSGYEGASTGSAAGGGAGAGGGWLASGGPVAAAGGLLLDVANQGPISQGVERVFGEYGLGGALSNALGIGTKTIDPSQYAWTQGGFFQGSEDPEKYTPSSPKVSLPDPYNQYKDLYERAFSTPEGRQLWEQLSRGNTLTPYKTGTTEFSDFIKTLQGLDKGKKSGGALGGLKTTNDTFNNLFSSLPDMY